MPHNDSPIAREDDIREFRNDARQFYGELIEVKFRIDALEKIEERRANRQWEIVMKVAPWFVLLIYIGFRHWETTQALAHAVIP